MSPRILRRPARVVAEVLGREADVHRLGDPHRLAVVERLELGELVGVARRSAAARSNSALVRAAGASLAQPPSSASRAADRPVHVLGAAVRDLRDLLARRGVDASAKVRPSAASARSPPISSRCGPGRELAGGVGEGVGQGGCGHAAWLLQVADSQRSRLPSGPKSTVTASPGSTGTTSGSEPAMIRSPGLQALAVPAEQPRGQLDHAGEVVAGRRRGARSSPFTTIAAPSASVARAPAGGLRSTTPRWKTLPATIACRSSSGRSHVHELDRRRVAGDRVARSPRTRPRARPAELAPPPARRPGRLRRGRVNSAPCSSSVAEVR